LGGDPPVVSAEHVSVSDIARVMAVSRNTVKAAFRRSDRSKLFELLRDGVVPSVRIGRRRRIAALDLSDLIDELRIIDYAQR
jgi:Mn-dependent DtxR family transcriptional regulator